MAYISLLLFNSGGEESFVVGSDYGKVYQEASFTLYGGI
jgi:hypothetical protein